MQKKTDPKSWMLQYYLGLTLRGRGYYPPLKAIGGGNSPFPPLDTLRYVKEGYNLSKLMPFY